MTLRTVSNPNPYIACVLAAGEAQDRMRQARPGPPINPRPHADPAKRRNNPVRDYGLTADELPTWRRYMTAFDMTAMEAANIILRSRREAR